ncbi:hypothetical protein [Lacimicrobium alkaliphilum]|uniref:DNA polymerase III subunit psi n=1 Tax=Lacimicrobium alkaliphilum TaxID=1526571 RepID=A0ABQ1R5T3_9ALTE|nr:hypothetical protein [Lacimicrobium alkaliphilum]GGD55912.1 hypothetical protein GCM10011357_09390 [Lacimicrobium alkaliphilum]
MKALSSYQQAILTELGIVQWQLRSPEHLAFSRDESLSQTAAVSAPSERPEQEPPIAATSPASQPEADRPLTDNHTDSDKMPAAVSAPNPCEMVDNQHPMFKDIQLALKSQQRTEEWQWQIGDTLSFDGNTLCAPTPQILAHSPELKRQLWQLLQQHL